MQFHDGQDSVRTLTVSSHQDQVVTAQAAGLELSTDITGLMHDGQFILASAGGLG